MQLLSTLSLVAGLASAVQANECKMNRFSSGNEWTVTASGVRDIPGTCGGLWDNLKRWPVACLVGYGTQYCREEGPGQLKWYFATTDLCNEGHVESAWWHATRNRFGDIQCKDCSPGFGDGSCPRLEHYP
ncbi:hypothetical protein PG993_002354 [Apiospora rasikravindrae]|uniref:Uncharacterized protein n=1 Tax=Apiospora rasikravindrae TaxID=990691 RepID=A0ABR1TWE2_9PEZI